MTKWSKKVIQDRFFKDAKRIGYVSRAAFKLQEIQRRFKVIPKGGSVLDLGCVPGAWMQVACQELGPRRRGGLVLGIDIQDVQRPESFLDDRVKTLKADVFKIEAKSLLQYSSTGFDVVLSDMLHFTSGNAELDVGSSLELSGMALHLAVGYYHDLHGSFGAEPVHEGILKPRGHLVMKLYEGSGTVEFVKDVQKYFEKVSRLRPEATRKTSREFYLIGRNRKQTPKT